VLKARVHSAKIQDLKKASRFCWTSRLNTLHTSPTCGWTPATPGKAGERTGWRERWDGRHR
jgi:hypothetical protein